MVYYFLKEDYTELNRKIEELNKKIRTISLEIGKDVQEDRGIFTYEEGERQKYMWSSKLQELIRIRNSAKIVYPDSKNIKVSLGKHVTLKNEITGKTKTYKIGSYMILTHDEHAISYDTPLARFLIGAQVDEKLEGEIAGRKIILRIIKIE